MKDNRLICLKSFVVELLVLPALIVNTPPLFWYVIYRFILQLKGSYIWGVGMIPSGPVDLKGLNVPRPHLLSLILFIK